MKATLKATGSFLAPKCLPDAVHRVPLQFWHDVRVRIGGDVVLGVSEDLHHCAHRDVERKHKGGSSVAEIVEPLPGEAGPFELPLEPLGDPAPVQGRAGLRGEDEPPRIALPHRPRAQALFDLVGAVGTEDRDELFGQGDRAPRL